MRAETERAPNGDNTTLERRPNIVVLQNMLKKVSQTPLHNQYQMLVSSPSNSSVSPMDEWTRKQDGLADSELAQSAFKTDNNQLLPASAQNGAASGFQTSSPDVASSNPFYSYYLESGNKYNSDRDIDLKPSQEVHMDGISVPQPKFQSSPLENGATMSDSQKDFIQAFSQNHMQDNFSTSQSASSRDHYNSANLNSVDIYKENSPGNLYKDPQSYSSNMQDLSQNSREDGKVFDKSPSTLADPFQPSAVKEEDPFTTSKAPMGNPFYSASTNFQTNEGGFSHDNKFAYSGLSGSDLDVFSTSSTAEPFPSPVVKNLFGDGGSASDSFGAKTPDSKDVFGSALLVQPKYSNAPNDIVLTTPQGSKHGILQPTPFSQARKLMVSPDSSPTELEPVQLSRRPPKPLPRSRPPRLEKPPKPAKPVEPDPAGPPKPPPKPFKPLPKPPIRLRTKPEDNKAVKPEDYVVFEDILLTGQERCVEDWPEDSPQLQPDFKPAGKFRLRRESLRVKMDSEEGGGSGEDQDDAGSQGKKKERKFSLMSRRGSKDKLPGDDSSLTSPTQHKSSQDYFYEMNESPAEKEDGEQSWSDTKKQPLKKKVNQLLRRASTSLLHRHPAAESKDNNLMKKRMQMRESTARWCSQEAMLDNNMNEEEEMGQEEADSYTSKGKKKMKFKFVSTEEQPKGAYGFRNRTDSKEHMFEDVDQLKSLHSTRQGGLLDMNGVTSASMPAGLNDELYWPEDYKSHKKSGKKKGLHLARRSSKENMLNASFPDDKLDDEELNADGYKQKKNKFKSPVPPLVPLRKQKPIHNSPELGELFPHSHADAAQASCSDHWLDSGKPGRNPKVDYDCEVDDLGICKPQKKLKRKPFRKPKSKNKVWDGGNEDSAGNHMSEAARAEWMAAEKDGYAATGLEDSEGDGDTDSLMEWWHTVEQWDELPSDEEDKSNDSKSFTVLAEKVQRGLRVFNKVFTERAEVFWQYIIVLHALADDIRIFHQKAKAAGITGGTTAAVGGVTAIAGLALAPFTFGASLIVTAVGVGVATAGGITTASATISDNVNNMQERKKVEGVLQEYDLHFQDVAKILHFVNHGIYKLRGHPFLRSGTQHYSEDWEVRKAVQMISLVDSPIMQATEVTDRNLALLQKFQNGIDKYFLKESQGLKKGCKKEFVAQIKEVANVLNDGVVELNAIREELQNAVGNF
ncbi:uncharacterized protein si:cabz01007807.1 [Dunckerocampus dactyliophorus]|uniref:uncharacterized protein si:cabz01007807.1 n=1 Tax=Dunckerocampus dactyliophorus TaxID=161453 RepID=UPI00240503E0|nr:uncharacterized protein si:cabz01007807.1 [Dunckerocampus dactyliophorus]